MLPGQPARSGRRAENDLSCCMKLQGAPALERTSLGSAQGSPSSQVTPTVFLGNLWAPSLLCLFTPMPEGELLLVVC